MNVPVFGEHHFLVGKTLNFSVYFCREELPFLSLPYLEPGWLFTASWEVFSLEVLGVSTTPR